MITSDLVIDYDWKMRPSRLVREAKVKPLSNNQ